MLRAAQDPRLPATKIIKIYWGDTMKYFYCAIFLLLFSINNLFADNHENKKGYVLAFLDVQNKEVMAEYKKMTKPIIKKYGGKLLAARHPNLKEGYVTGVSAII